MEPSKLREANKKWHERRAAAKRSLLQRLYPATRNIPPCLDPSASLELQQSTSAKDVELSAIGEVLDACIDDDGPDDGPGDDGAGGESPGQGDAAVCDMGDSIDDDHDVNNNDDDHVYGAIRRKRASRTGLLDVAINNNDLGMNTIAPRPFTRSRAAAAADNDDNTTRSINKRPRNKSINNQDNDDFVQLQNGEQ